MAVRVGRGAMVAALVVVSGCFWQVPGARWNRSGHNDLETRITVETVGDLEQRWEATVDEGAVGDPVTSSKGVHVNDAHSVHAFDARTGAERWQHANSERPDAYQPYVWHDHVLATYTVDWGSSVVVELDAGTGAVIREIQDEILTALHGDRAVMKSIRWVPGAPPIFPGHYRFHLTVEDLATGDTWLGGSTSYTYVLTAVEPDVVTLADDWVLHAGPGVVDGDSYGEGLRAYSVSNPDTDCAAQNADLCPNWSAAGGGGDPLVVSGDGTVVYDATSAYEVATGDELWSRSTGAGSPPALANGLLYVADDAAGGGGMLYAYAADGCHPKTCDPRWSADLGFVPDVAVQPAVAGGVVFVAGAGGELAAIDAAGCAAPPCTPLWTASVGSQITGAPAVSHGQLYVGTADGRLVAFGLPAA